MSDYAVLLRYYRDEDRLFPLPRLDGMYVRPRYVIHQHELDELLNAIEVLRAKNERLLEALKQVERWWLDEEMQKHSGAPACMFAVRAELKRKPE
jgi:hypothetical protein